MSESTIAIVGSGIAAANIAYSLSTKGYDVVIFEKGPEYPYPHSKQFQEQIYYLYEDPSYTLPSDLKYLTATGDYQFNLNDERYQVLGGSATQWQAITLRMTPSDFRTKSLYGYGEDWPVNYNDLEPYYCQAEIMLGVSGTDLDNPFAVPRSKPYPLPPFELSYDDLILAERLRRNGIILHSTPQARTRQPYLERPSCENFGTCHVCPIGARYSPNFHLKKSVETGRCKVLTNITVRRILVDQSGRVRGLVCQPNDGRAEFEHAAKVVILAGGAIETVRLLLLSADEHFPNGLGNVGGQVGQHFTLNHVWFGNLSYLDLLFTGRFGGWTGQSHQFLDPPNRGKHGGLKVEFSSRSYVGNNAKAWKSEDMLEQMEPRRRTRDIALHAETISSPEKYVQLSDQKDRFGDPFAHVHYKSSDFDYETYQFAQGIYRQFVQATGAEESQMNTDPNRFGSGAHHMGGCRMGTNPEDSVVNSFGKIHGISNLFVSGSSIFVNTSGAINPTLTIIALSLRTADNILDQAL